MYIFKVKVISGICFKQTFLCVEQLSYMWYMFQKKFFVLNNYVIYF